MVDSNSKGAPSTPPAQQGNPHRNKGQVRTDVLCTNCHRTFIAQLDFDIDGNHVVECPYCGHEHCRTIRAGVITGERWDGRAQRVDVAKRNVWKSDVIQATTHSAAWFIRERWMNLGQDGDI